jgi:hypothetical protein
LETVTCADKPPNPQRGNNNKRSPLNPPEGDFVDVDNVFIIVVIKVYSFIFKVSGCGVTLHPSPFTLSLPSGFWDCFVFNFY